MIVLTCLAVLPGCSLTPLETEEAQKFAQKERIPRIVYIEVSSQGGETECFGSEDTWIEDVTEAFRDLNVAAAVWSEGDEERTAKEADLAVTLTLLPGEPQSGEPDRQIVGYGAFLDFLAWSTVPILPMWIADVRVVPHLIAVADVRVVPHLIAGVELTVRDGDGQKDSPEYLDVPKLETSFRDRYRFFSWATLGAVFVPPFVFREGDPEHLATSIAGRVRGEVAWKLAEFLKTWNLGDDQELLKDLRVEKEPEGEGYSLLFEASPHVWYLELRYDSGDSEPKRTKPFKVGRESWTEYPLALSKFLDDAGSGEGLLRITAFRRESGKKPEQVSYSVRLPRKD